MERKTIAIMTGGGDCPGLNAVIRAVVRSAHAHDLRVMGIERGFGGLLGNGRVRELGLDDVRDILNRGGTIIGTSNRGDPFHFASPNGPIDRSPEIIAGLAKHDVKALISVGGDGSQRISLELAKLGVNVIGVPKTIDNDLDGTDVTFGFNTAYEIATEALDRLHSTAESHDRVMVLEVMGRDAGFIALETAIAGAADICLIPEIPFDMNAVCERIITRVRRGTFFSLVVVAEGAFERGGDTVTVDEPRGTKRYGGIGEVVAHKIREQAQREVRVTVLGHLQRGGEPSAFDRVLATRLGVHAVEVFLKGEKNVLVGIRGDRMVSTPLEEALKVPRRVDPRGEVCAAARAVGVSFGEAV